MGEPIINGFRLIATLTFRLSRSVLAPERHTFEKVLIAKLATQYRQLCAARATPSQIVEGFNKWRIGTKRGEPAIEIGLVAVVTKAGGERGRAAHDETPFALTIGNRFQVAVACEH